jgi:hypothetical protein
MKTQTAIQSQANVIRITSVSAGDVYKRFEESSYDDRTYFGVVKAVHNDGDKTIIEATEYAYKYSSIEVAHKIISGVKEVTIFPSSPDELSLELGKAREKLLKDVQDAEDKIAKSNQLIAEVDGLMSGETLKNLKAMSYTELTQNEYESKKMEAGL